MRGFAHARKIRLFPLETENGENNLCRLRIFLGSRRFSPSLSFSFPYRLWWRYEGSVIAIINRAGVQRCRSTSRAIVSREQWRDRSHPRRRSIFIESSPAPPSLFPLTARFYRRYSTWCGKRFGTRLLQRAKGGFGRRWRLAARKHFALPVGSAGDASIKIANSANGFRRFHSFRSRPSIAPLCRFDTLRRR